MHNLFRDADDDELSSSIVVAESGRAGDDVVPSSSSSVLDVPWGPMIGNNEYDIVAADEGTKDGISQREGIGNAYNDDKYRTKMKKNKKKRTTSPKEERMAEPNDYDNVDEEEDPAVEEEGGGRIMNKIPQQKRKKANSAQQYYMNMDPLSWTLPQPAYPIRNQTSEEFMLHYIAMKRGYNISLPWEENDDNDNDMYNNTMNHQVVSLPLPIISLNFPKSATLTMSAYFDCAGLTSIHTSTQNGRIALCMLENQLYNQPPMYNCDTHMKRNSSSKSSSSSSVPIDFFSDIGLQGPPCYYASLHDGGLENIARHYPNATILLVTRNAASWYHSMIKWGGIMGRWKKYCGFDGHLHTTTTSNNSTNDMEYWKNMYNEIGPSREREEMYWINFYNAHTQKIREFVLQHLSLTYIEVEIENPNIGSILHHYTKVSPECVLYCHPGPHWIKKHNTITKCHPIGQEPALLKEGEIWPGYKKTRSNSDDNNRDDDEGNNETLREEGEEDVEEDDD